MYWFLRAHSILFGAANDNINIPKASPEAAFQALLKIAFAAAGALSVFYVTYAGFKYTTSQGDPQAISRAKSQIIYGIIGLVISISAFSIINFVLGRL